MARATKLSRVLDLLSLLDILDELDRTHHSSKRMEQLQRRLDDGDRLRDDLPALLRKLRAAEER